MKKDGFTLVELIAVIAILGVLALVVTVSVNKTLTNSEKKLNAVQIEKIKDAAKIYYLNEGKSCVNVSYLIENDYIEKMNIKNSEENGTLGSVRITYNSKKYTYEYQENVCPYTLTGVCKIVSGKEKQIGSKYECKVSDDMEEDFEDGYYFYVLSYNDSDGNLTDDINDAKSLNLIMDRNMCDDGTAAISSHTCEVMWHANPLDNSYGPVVAMAYLHRATKDWTNVPPLNYEYRDVEWQESLNIQGDSGYESFISIDGEWKINDVEFTGEGLLRSRMPLYAHIDGGIEYGEVSDKKDDNSNAFLYENLKVSGVNGYWTLSSRVDDSRFAWHVDVDDTVYDNYVDDENSGVRPVITLGI